MRIVSRDELCKYPNGTVFMCLLSEHVTDHEIHILTGCNQHDNWLGEMSLTPCWTKSYDEIFSQWSTVDSAMCDYNETDQFIVFSKDEVSHMIQILIWALTGCQIGLNEDIWFDDNGGILTDNDVCDE